MFYYVFYLEKDVSFENSFELDYDENGLEDMADQLLEAITQGEGPKQVAPSAPRLGNQRPWYVQPRLCDWAYERSRATYRKEKGIVSLWSISS